MYCPTLRVLVLVGQQQVAHAVRRYLNTTPDFLRAAITAEAELAGAGGVGGAATQGHVPEESSPAAQERTNFRQLQFNRHASQVSNRVLLSCGGFSSSAQILNPKGGIR